MIPLSLKTVALLIPFFIACIAIIHIQPYDNGELRAFLTPPEDCPMPCFLGIRPGATTYDEALSILESHEWVGEVRANVYHRGGAVGGFIFWRWSGRQHPLLLANSQQTINVQDSIVKDISVYTSISLADTWMLYGFPSRAIVDILPSSVYRAMILNSNGYPEVGLAVVSFLPCPTSFETFWESPVMLSFGALPDLSIMPARGVLESVVYWNQACRG